MSLRLTVVGIVLAMVGFGCAGKGAKPAVAEAPQGPVIVRLVGQHQTITVTSGPDGPLYTAQTSDGQMIVANATLAELRVSHPEVYQFIEPSIAAEASVAPARPPEGRPNSTSGASRDVLMLDSAR